MGILREPLVHFLVLGCVVYAVTRHFGDDPVRYQIEAGPRQRARLEATYRQQYGVPPTSGQLEQLLQQYVRSEILYREGLALGLERDDEIVRRRVVQKIEFVNEDLDPATEPQESELSEYFSKNREKYATPSSVTFRQVFFSADAGGAAKARARSLRTLGVLAHSGPQAAEGIGDAFSDGADFVGLTRGAANTLFGELALSAALFSAGTGQWTGPYESAYGWHLIYIQQRTGAQPASLDAVRERVRADYKSDLRAQRNAAAFQRLASKYRIITAGPSA